MTSQEYQVRDGDRVLEFRGDLLAESGSQGRGKTRWIEFKLFRTQAGSYILSRIGNSVVYHAGSCSLVSQYRLKPGEVAPDAAQCDMCRPGGVDGPLFPERIRYWAQVMDQPQAVLEALMKYDASGARYLTLVAQRLLAQAAEVDDGICNAYMVERVA